MCFPNSASMLKGQLANDPQNKTQKKQQQNYFGSKVVSQNVMRGTTALTETDFKKNVCSC